MCRKDKTTEQLITEIDQLRHMNDNYRSQVTSYKKLSEQLQADITERKQAEEELRASEQRFRMIYENAPALIDAFDENGRCVLWNKECHRVFGWTIDEIKAHDDALSLFYPDPAVRNEVLKTVTTDPEGNFREWHPVTKDGKTLITMWANFRLPDGMTFSLGYDITKLKKAEEELCLSEDKFRLLFEKSLDGIVVVNTKGRFIMANEAVAKNLGYSVEEFLELNLFDIEVQESETEVKQHIEEMLRGERLHFETLHKRKDGSIINVEILLNIIEMDGQTVTCSIWRDITERKQAREALIKAHEKLEQRVQERTADLVETNEKLSREIEERKQLEKKLENLAKFPSENPNPVLRISKNGKILYANEASKLLLDKWKADVGETVPQKWYNLITEAFVSEKGTEEEEEVQGKTFSITITPVKETGYANLYASNITKREKIKKKLLEEQEFLQAVLSNIQDGIVACDSKGKLTFFNHATREFHGLLAKSIPPDQWAEHYDLYLSDGNTIMRKEDIPLYRALQGEHVRDIEMVISPKHGQTRTLLADGQPLITADGRKIGAVVAMHDFTKRKQIENDLRKAATYINAMGDALVVMDMERKVIEFNTAALNLFGYSWRETSELTFERLFPQKVHEEYYAKMKYGIKGRETKPFETIALTKTGKEIPILLSGTLLKDANDEPIGFVGVCKDISDLKEAENEAQKHREELLHVSRLSTVGEMASGLAHELNQPLCAILTHGNVCLRTSETGIKDIGKFRANLKVITAQSKLAGEIVNRIKDFVQKREPRRTKININDIIHETVSFLSTLMQNNEIRLDLQLNAQTPFILADPIQIEQVLINLTTNALESMRSVTDRKRQLSFQTSRTSDTELEIAVSDTGEGFSETPDKLFEPFFTTKKDGLGIGLSISRSIIDAHGGTICAERNPDYGSTFRVTLPVVNINDKTTACEKES